MMNNALSVEISPDECGDITLNLLEETRFDLDGMHECHSASIKYVLFHCDLIIKHMLAEKITTENGGNQVAAEKEYKDLFHYVRENEMSVYYGFDQFVYFHRLGTSSNPATKLYHEWWWDWDESDR